MSGPSGQGTATIFRCLLVEVISVTKDAVAVRTIELNIRARILDWFGPSRILGLASIFVPQAVPIPCLIWPVTNCANNRILGQQVVVENQGGRRRHHRGQRGD